MYGWATETGEASRVAVETFPKKKTFWQREWVVAAVFLAPFMILFLVFRVYPIIQAVTLSFDNVESIGQSEFIGLGNYQELASDERFLDAVGNNALYTIGTLLLLIPIPLALAALLYSGLVKGAGGFRTVLFVPLLAGLVVVAAVFQLLLNVDGILNRAWRPSGCRARPGWRRRDSPFPRSSSSPYGDGPESTSCISRRGWRRFPRISMRRRPSMGLQGSGGSSASRCRW